MKTKTNSSIKWCLKTLNSANKHCSKFIKKKIQFTVCLESHRLGDDWLFLSWVRRQVYLLTCQNEILLQGDEPGKNNSNKKIRFVCLCNKSFLFEAMIHWSFKSQKLLILFKKVFKILHIFTFFPQFVSVYDKFLYTVRHEKSQVLCFVSIIFKSLRLSTFKHKCTVFETPGRGPWGFWQILLRGTWGWEKIAGGGSPWGSVLFHFYFPTILQFSRGYMRCPPSYPTPSLFVSMVSKKASNSNLET